MGNGTIQHGGNAGSESFEFEGPIDMLRLTFEFKVAPETEYATTGKILDIKSFDFTVDGSKVQIKATGDKQALFEDHHHGQQIRKWIEESLTKAVNNIKTGIFEDARIDLLAKIPA